MPQNTQLQTRAAANAWGPRSYNEKTRSCQATVATENPVEVMDHERYEPVLEVLLMDGAEFPENGQVPLLDSHSRRGVADVLGSVRQFSIAGDKLEATVYFSDDEQGRSAAAKVQQGHLTDFSVGYRLIESEFIPAGQTKIMNHRSFSGPVRITSRWSVKEISVTAIGADADAKSRSNIYHQTNNNSRKDYTMPEITEEQRAEIARQERARVMEITAMATHFGFEELGRTLVENGATEEQARIAVMDLLSKTKPKDTPGFRPAGYFERVEMGRTHEEKEMEAIIDGQVLRCGVPLKDPAPGADEFRVMSFSDMARHCLHEAGKSIRGLSADRAVQLGLKTRMHTSSDFPLILENIAGKVLREKFKQAPGTFGMITRKSTVSDFKETSRVAMGEGPDLVEVPEGAEYKYGTIGEGGEKYKIATYGRIFNVTRQTLVNDDLGAFSRVPMLFGSAAMRLINGMAYAVLTNNAVMADGNALFHSLHGNISDPGAELSIDSLSAARLAMRYQTGIDGVVLGITPRYLVVSPTLETLADTLINTPSGYDLEEGVGQANPFYKKLDLVVDAALTGNGWYLSADPNLFDTIEVGYLDGIDTPQLFTDQGWTVDGTEFKVRIDVGVKALDWRGLYYNAGAAE